MRLNRTMYYESYYGVQKIDAEYVKHHGVKGQQWGVRRGPPYPIQTGMKKGTKLASVSYWSDKQFKTIKEKQRMLYTYNPKDKWDRKVYRGPFSAYKYNQVLSPILERQFVTTKDLKMPTSKARHAPLHFQHLLPDLHRAESLFLLLHPNQEHQDPHRISESS